MAINLIVNNVTNIRHNSAQLNGNISGIASGKEYKTWFLYFAVFYSHDESFENWTSADLLPIDWIVTSASGTEGNISKENTIVSEGNYALKILADAKTILVKTLIVDIIPYRNKFIVLESDLRCNVSNEARVRIKIDGDVILDKNNGTTLDSWVEIDEAIAIPSDAIGSLTIEVYSGDVISSGMVAYFDNIFVGIRGAELITPYQLIDTDGNFNDTINNLLFNGQFYAVFAVTQLNESGASEIDSDNDTSFKSGFFQTFSTDLRTKILKVFKYLTNLIVNIRTFNKYSTKLYTKSLIQNKFATDLRVRLSDYDLIQPGNLNDFIVKLDGNELTDVDYSTLRVTYNKNSTPSIATFVLGRYHDKLDYKLDNTFSEITNENKIEIYDGTYKIFTGYINQINANSDSDTVSISAEDVRYKMRRQSMELWYGGGYNAETGDINKRYEKNIGTAFGELIGSIGSLISGYDALSFSTSFVPEYTKTFNDYASLLDELINNSANANWYIDENERLKFIKIGQGDIKTLSLSSLNSKRHTYDTIIDNIILNKKTDNYTQALNVKLGTHIIRQWNRMVWIDGQEKPYTSNLKEYTLFCFQNWYGAAEESNPNTLYVGISERIFGFIVASDWILSTGHVGQYLAQNTSDNLSDITVGSGEPKKTIYLTNYGKKDSNIRWEEKSKEELVELGYFHNIIEFINDADSSIYLTKIQGETYDYSDFANNVANFELNQNNKLITQATVTLLLDAYKYYNIKMKDRINLNNTVENSIYNNNNGFPLNIDSVTINCANRVVTLNLTNYGKTWYERTGNYINNYSPETLISAKKKSPVQHFISGY